jgi:hypothetical protein
VAAPLKQINITMKSNKELKVPYKMRKAIERLVKKYGELHTSYHIETIAENRHNVNYYDYCDITMDYISLKYRVAYDGTVTPLGFIY